MAALTAERSVPRKGVGDSPQVKMLTVPLKAGQKCFKGGIVAINTANGYGYSGTGLQATGMVTVGIASKTVDNTSGADGALSVDVERGMFPFAILGADTFGQAFAGQAVYVEDDQTVRKTSATSTRSAAGMFWGLDENGLALVELGSRSATGV